MFLHKKHPTISSLYQGNLSSRMSGLNKKITHAAKSYFFYILLMLFVLNVVFQHHIYNGGKLS